MNRLKASLAIAVLFLNCDISSSASVSADAAEKLANQHHGEDRVLHGKDLSDKEKGTLDYDHEAFLGHDEAEEFDTLTPEESQARLAGIVDKIDHDQDGYVTFEEMRKWIQFSQARYIVEDVVKQWNTHTNEDENVAELEWLSYRDMVYGFLDEELKENEGDESFAEEHEAYKKMETRDRRRWDMADEDKDGKLTQSEFSNFLHPEEADHMRDIVVQETLEDIDRDHDGKISENEYIGDMYTAPEGEEANPEDLEPDWVKTEREQFAKFRDTDGDGFMNLDEVKNWIIPADFDHSEAEAKHLIFESDVDQDGKLTKEEILEKYDLFVGSQATDFGEALMRHDEF